MPQVREELEDPRKSRELEARGQAGGGAPELGHYQGQQGDSQRVQMAHVCHRYHGEALLSAFLKPGSLSQPPTSHPWVGPGALHF